MAKGRLRPGFQKKGNPFSERHRSPRPTCPNRYESGHGAGCPLHAHGGGGAVESRAAAFYQRLVAAGKPTKAAPAMALAALLPHSHLGEIPKEVESLESDVKRG